MILSYPLWTPNRTRDHSNASDHREMFMEPKHKYVARFVA